MPNFIYDNTSLPFPKTDLVPIPVGADEDKYVQASDWNTTNQAITDIKSVLRGAFWLGLTQQSSDPAPAGVSRYLWLKDDGTLHYKNGAGDQTLARLSDLGAGSVGGMGTTNHIPKWTGASAIGDSPVLHEPSESRITIPQRLNVSANLGDTSTQHGGILLICSGSGLTTNDGGVQSFHQGIYNLPGGAQAFAHYGNCTATNTSGTMINTGVYGSASGGSTNYSFFGGAGVLRNNDGAILGTPVAIGSGSAGTGNQVLLHCDLEIDSGQTVKLGDNVANFKVPGVGGAEPTIYLGWQSGTGQLQTKNVVGQAAVISHFADTNVNASAYCGNRLFRGTSATVRAGVNVGAGGGQFALGDTANALVIWSFDGSGTTFGIELATGINPNVRVRIDPQGNTILLNGFAKSGTISPAALAAGITNDYNPANFNNCNRVRITTNAAGSSLGGLVPNGIDGQEIEIINLGPNTLTIIDAETTELTTAYRFALEGGINKVLGVNGQVTVQYDSTSSRWRAKG